MTEPHNHYGGYAGTRTVVLGASGFIGRWVARALCERGASVYLVIRDSALANEIFSRYRIQGEILDVDLRDAGAVQELFQEVKPSITFNLAGYGVDRSERDKEIAYQINAELPKRICETIEEIRDPNWSGRDVVHAGSALEYGAVGGNLSENSIPNPTTLYGKSKLTGTRSLVRCCRVHGVKGVTARLFTVYGPGEHEGRLLPSLLETARTGKPLKLTAGKQKRDFTYVEDVAEGLLRLGLATAEPGQIVNLATGQLTSVRNFVETAARALQIPYERLNFGSLPTRPEEMEHDNVALNRLRRLITWVPPTEVAEGIRKTRNFGNAYRDEQV